MTFKGTVKIEQEEEWFVATCLENNVASQGKTVNDAVTNLKEAIALYYEKDLYIKVKKEVMRNTPMGMMWQLFQCMIL